MLLVGLILVVPSVIEHLNGSQTSSSDPHLCVVRYPLDTIMRLLRLHSILLLPLGRACDTPGCGAAYPVPGVCAARDRPYFRFPRKKHSDDDREHVMSEIDPKKSTQEPGASTSLPLVRTHVPSPRIQWLDSKTGFFRGLLLAASGIVSPPVALVGGLAFGFTLDHPYKQESSTLSKTLLQIAVVLLGFGTNLHKVLQVGRAGFLYTAVSITVALTLGLLLGKSLKIGSKTSYLITMGTAICGGSAIAALSPIMQAGEEEISISMGTVFLLNSVALLLFPIVGWSLHLSQSQFGLWAAFAIHDTSSVVGTAAKYGDHALAIGTTVKLARALWIVPISLLTASFLARDVAIGEGGKESEGAHSMVHLSLLTGLRREYSCGQVRLRLCPG